MDTLDQRITVTYDYRVHFTRDLFEERDGPFARTLRNPDRSGPSDAFVVLDRGVLEHHPELPDRIERYGREHEGLRWTREPIVLPGGEDAKNDPALIDRMRRAVYEDGLCRHSYVVAIGGGAVLDAAGFAAATAHRGVRHVRVPTTVLAQNDSGVGVKNGVNAFGTKNFVGTFAPPYAVFNDATFLTTLDDRDWRAGISEAVKVALLKDPAFFEWLEEQAGRLAPPVRDLDRMERLIHRCAELHAEHIATSGDPFEKGSSRPLDFGHWAAHRLEDLTDYELRHGEAVAVGLALDVVYSHLEGRIDERAVERVLGLFTDLGFEIFVPALTRHLDDPDHPESIFRGLESFREHLGGRLTIMLLEEIGRGVEVHAVDRALYREAVERLRAVSVSHEAEYGSGA